MFPPHPFTPDRLTPPRSLSSSAYSTPYSSQWDSVPSPRPQRPSPRSTPTAFQRKTLIAPPSIVPKAPLIGPKTPKIRSPPPDSNNAVVHSTEEACSSRTPPELVHLVLQPLEDAFASRHAAILDMDPSEFKMLEAIGEGKATPEDIDSDVVDKLQDLWTRGR